MHRRAATLMLLLAPLGLAAQQQLASVGDPPPRSATATANVAAAIRAATPPDIDGRDDDPIWQQAQLIDSFRTFVPTEDSAPTFRTTAKVAYDDRYLYVVVRAYDPHPDSIIGYLSRRDIKTNSDQIKVMIDSYHDKRTGYEFAVNPAGVKRDYYTFNDSEEDDSWDAVWDVETRIDSAGWVAEFRIPLSQLRFVTRPSMTFGFAVVREIPRLNERVSWPVYRRSKPGISSQLGELQGIDGLVTPRRLEVMPYAVTKNITLPQTTAVGAQSVTTYGRQQDLAIGADLKYGVTPNLTLDGTINPDFGQVESDPAVLNLSAFDTYLHERRPFFVEGTGIFRFDLSCNNGNCTGLFYSRRVGRQPQLSDGLPGTPTATSIISAAKLTGRMSGGLSVGVLDALTAREDNSDGTVAEPAANYFAGRLSQEFRDGQSALGIMATAVNRQTDPTSAAVLRTDAYATGVDFRHQFGKRGYELAGLVGGSYVGGSAAAIDSTQTTTTSTSAKYYQRPDRGLPYDPTRTSLTGDIEKLSLSKISGVVRFFSGFSRVSPGFEINDLGYLTQADVQSWSNWFGLNYTQPHSFYRQLYVNFNEFNNWTTQRLSIASQSSMSANVNASAELRSGWWVNAGFAEDNILASYDALMARGGPAVRHSPVPNWWGGIQSDPRMKVGPDFFFFGYEGSGGRSHGWGVDPDVRVTWSSSLAMVVALHYDLNVDNGQWIGNFINGADTSYTFAHLHQSTASATVRFDAIFTPRISLQFYAQPFITLGSYSNWRELNQPRAVNYDDRYKPYTAPDSVGVDQYNFNYQALNVNTVVRWEYRRGSTLFIVWTHGRSYYDQNPLYTGFSPGQSVDHLFGVHPMNTILVKASYWLSL